MTPPIFVDSSSKIRELFCGTLKGRPGSPMASSSPFRKRWEGFTRSSSSTAPDEAPANITLALKCARPRTAKIMTKMGIKSGFMVKRNEQGVWQRRYCALVPHTFLYYYEADDADSPRGVIDMEYYTDLSMDDKQVIKFATQEGSTKGRTFFFQVTDGETEASEWVSSLIHGRYLSVRDERDAYMALQEEYSTQIKEALENVASANRDKQQVQSELVAQRRSYAANFIKVKLFLQDMGVVLPEGQGEPPDVVAALEKIQQVMKSKEGAWQRKVEETVESVNRMKGLADAQEEVWTKRYEEQRALIERLQAQLEDEQRQRQKDEQHLSSIRECSQLLEAQLNESQVNHHRLSKDHKAMEAKVAELNEQKKVLVKALKSSRSALQESRKANKKLLTAYNSIDKKYQAQKALYAEGLELASMGRSDTYSPSTVGDLSVDIMLEDSASVASSHDPDEGGSPRHDALRGDHGSDKQITSQGTDISVDSSTSTKVDGNLSLGARLFGTPKARNKEGPSAPPPPPPSSASSVAGNAPTITIPTANDDPGPKGQVVSSPSMGFLSHFGGSASSLRPHPSSISQQSPTKSAALMKGFSSKLRGLLNDVESIDGYLFKPSQPSTDNNQQQQSAALPTSQQTYIDLDGVPRSIALPPQGPSSSPPPPPTENIITIDPPAPAPVKPIEVQRCGRCNGTVEGPKNSTCKCSEPLLGDGAHSGNAGVGAGKETAAGISSFFSIFTRNDSGSYARNRGSASSVSSVFSTASLFSDATRSRDGSLAESNSSISASTNSAANSYLLPSLPRAAKLKLDSPTNRRRGSSLNVNTSVTNTTSAPEEGLLKSL